jgi:periplasmic copper chaperone A
MNLNHAALYHGDRKTPAAQIACMKRRTFLLLALLPNVAHAHSYKLGDIAIGHAWGLPSKDGETQIFMPLFNSGTASDTLVSASYEGATSAELRASTDYNAPAQTGFELQPKKPFPMRPTANHIRLIGLAKPLVSGDRISITLKFKTSGETKIEVHIQEKAGE